MGIIRQLDYGSFGGLYSCINLSQWPRFISGWLGGSLLFCHVPPTCSLAFSHPVAETIRCIRHATPLFCRQSHRPILFCVLFLFYFFSSLSWQPTIDLWLCSQCFKFQVQSLGLTVPTVILVMKSVMKSDPFVQTVWGISVISTRVAILMTLASALCQKIWEELSFHQRVENFFIFHRGAEVMRRIRHHKCQEFFKPHMNMI